MALQVCSRCRKKRIKCDLQLPACKTCRHADVECTFWDDSLDQEIPCSYLHSLQQKVESLQAEIQQATDQGRGTSMSTVYELSSSLLPEQDYHLNLADPGGLPLPSRTIYLGPGSAASLIDRLLTEMTTRHLANSIQIPQRLLPNHLSTSSSAQDSEMMRSFPTTNDPRKLELHSLLPPSTQRAVIEHYLTVVTPEYTLLPVEQESTLLTHENPLKWASSNKNDPAAFSLNIVFAVSTALITRDLDFGLASVFMRSREIVQQISLRDEQAPDPLSAARWTCTSLCALALCEFICPISGQLWDLLGRAGSTMEDLREGLQLRHSDVDTDFRRLERAFLQLESMIARHFRRTSLILDTRLRLCLEKVHPSDALADELYFASCLHNISHALTTVAVPTETYLESLIPISLQISSLSSEIKMPSATLYTALHPLFTHPDSFARSGTFNIPSPRIIHTIAKSAAVVIDHFTRLNQRQMIISIWIAAERVVEAGAVWAAYLIRERSLSGRALQGVAINGTDFPLAPIVKVSSLLASFAARWKPGSAYANNWETLVELLWKML